MINYKNKCSDAQIMKMTVESWALVDIDDLELLHSLSHGAGLLFQALPLLLHPLSILLMSPLVKLMHNIF